MKFNFCYHNRMRNKHRLTVTVDPDLVEAGLRAVAAGTADSLSAWVSMALVDRVAKERRLWAMSEAIALYEAEFGEITREEMAAQAREDRRRARVVRGTGDGAA